MTMKTVTTLLLLVGVALQTHGGYCPQHDSLPTTCECKDTATKYAWMDEVDIWVTCKSSTILELKNVMSLIDKKSKLKVELKAMNLGTLPSQIFDGWNVVKLYISHCELDSLSPERQVALAGLEDKLEVLMISSSFTEENVRTKIDLSHLRRLKQLYLFYNSITELGNDWFANGPTSLTKLLLRSNRIFNLGDKAFENLVNLKGLELTVNRFGELKRSMFPRPANRLEVLNLEDNGFISFADDLFIDMPALKYLLFLNNGIAHLKEQVFKPIWSKIHMFDARNNSIECDSTMEWMFHFKTPFDVIGTCQGPLGRKGVKLADFIESKG